jgi:hypothetical protein
MNKQDTNKDEIDVGDNHDNKKPYRNRTQFIDEKH